MYARSHGDRLSVSVLIDLLADLGVDGPAVRSALSRLKRREVLLAVRHGGAAAYALSETSLSVLAEGDERIFGRRRATTEDGWLLAVFSVPESARDKRHQLRTSLTRLGFGTVTPGVWVAPGHLGSRTRGYLERRGLAEFVELFRADHLAEGDLATAVQRWWDLDELAAQYAGFVGRVDALAEAPEELAADPARAFAAYLPVLTAWRRLPYLDPGLPVEALPEHWPGEVAERRFSALDSALRAPARVHVEGVIGARDLLRPHPPRA